MCSTLTTTYTVEGNLTKKFTMHPQNKISNMSELYTLPCTPIIDTVVLEHLLIKFFIQYNLLRILENYTIIRSSHTVKTVMGNKIVRFLEKSQNQGNL